LPKERSKIAGRKAIIICKNICHTNEISFIINIKTTKYAIPITYYYNYGTINDGYVLFYGIQLIRTEFVS